MSDQPSPEIICLLSDLRDAERALRENRLTACDRSIRNALVLAQALAAKHESKSTDAPSFVYKPMFDVIRDVMKIIDCPAMHEKDHSYPFGDKVPRKVQLLRTVRTDPPMFESKKSSHIAVINRVMPCWTNKYGAVSVVFEDGSMLGVKPHEFKVVGWHD